MLSVIALRTEDEWLVSSVCILDSQPHDRYLRPVRALCCPRMGTDAVPIYRAMFVDLDFDSAPGDLMAKFVGSLVPLPNLKTLEAFSTDHNELFLGGLKQKSAWCPSVRKLGVNEATVKLVGNCPNVEGAEAHRRSPRGCRWTTTSGTLFNLTYSP